MYYIEHAKEGDMPNLVSFFYTRLQQHHQAKLNTNQLSPLCRKTELNLSIVPDMGCTLKSVIEIIVTW